MVDPSRLFDWLGDRENYDYRMVGRDEFEWGFVSTARVSDGAQPFETAIQCDLYEREGDGATDDMCIVEGYDTMEEAEAGHAKWVKRMEKPPRVLKDCGNGLGGFSGMLEICFVLRV